MKDPDTSIVLRRTSALGDAKMSLVISLFEKKCICSYSSKIFCFYICRTRQSYKRLMHISKAIKNQVLSIVTRYMRP